VPLANGALFLSVGREEEFPNVRPNPREHPTVDVARLTFDALRRWDPSDLTIGALLALVAAAITLSVFAWFRR
jgi:hypothetical protein